MPDDSQHHYRNTQLDPALLSSPFRVQTRWHVITGAACCGKTTLIDLLAGQGYQTAPETARLYIEGEIARGRALEEIFEDVATEPRIVEMQLGIEHGLRAMDVVFLDRALPDSLWFYRLAGRDPNELLAECFHHRYASVFILDRLPFELNGARIEDDTFTDLFEECLVRDYSALGYTVVRVPVLSPEERAAFALERLSDQGLL
jgi:predicted ATPase